MQNLVFLAQNAQIWKFGPNMEIPPKYENTAPDHCISTISNNYCIFRCLLSLPFQRALNDLRIFVQTEIMSNLVFLAQNAQIWKFGPRPLNFDNFLKLCVF